ncbi:MAG: Cof-type HAD-IIB family hydrolase [Gorillibacterium sp.]|nr:Cof-type HAD-IIB family hydrolase [Gorillibacterium sp.]
MFPYKLIALDMDGTLLNEEKKISPENRKWIHRAIEHGIPVMFATGRGVQSVAPYVEELSLLSPMVSVNGGEVWESPDILLSRHEMQKDWIRELQSIAIEHDTWYWAYAVEGLFNKERWVEDVDSIQWLKFGFYTEESGLLPKIQKLLATDGRYELTNSHLCNIEINPKGVSKASGIQEVCSLLDVRMDQVIAMGDSLNDLKMIRSAGLGVAMGNAQDGVKAAADVITSSNDEDGVALIIKEYIFGEKG